MNWDQNTVDQDDPILDACLEEVLAGRTPPDVSSRVLAALKSGFVPEPPPVQAPVHSLVDAASTNTAPAIVTVSAGGALKAGKRAARDEERSAGRAIALAAGIVGIGLTVGLLSLHYTARPQVAHAPVEPPSNAVVTDAAPAQPRVTTAPDQDDANLAERRASPDVPAPNSVDSVPPRQLAADAAANSTPATPELAPPPLPEPAPRPAASNEQIISFVNIELSSAWTAAGVSASPAIGDDEWCARVFQRTLGRGPTAAELKQFQDDEATARRELLLNRVLGEQYHNLFARNWSQIFTSELLGSTTARPDSLASRGDLERYLTGSLRNNKPLTTIVTELLTARGASQPGPGYSPAVNFLLEGWDPTAALATSRVARVFLGQRLECAQCHTHPTAGWTQEQYWSFNAFFRQMRVDTTDEATRLVNINYLGERRGSRDGEVYFETPDGLVKTAWPRFLDGTELPRSGQLSVVDRRRELARLVVESEYLPRAIVNHVWAQYFDYGLLPALHDLGESKSSLHAELLDRLASEFVASGFDLKRLIRWTIMSDAFARSTKLTDLATKDMPESGEPALFSRYYSRPQAGADLLTSLAQAQRIRRTAGTSAERDQARVDWLAQFNRSSAKTGSKAAAKAAAKTSSILLEASTIRATAGLQATGIVPKLAAHSMSFDQKVEHLFLAALGRRPSQRETRSAAAALTAAGDNQGAALEDIWWSLLSSNECLLDR